MPSFQHPWAFILLLLLLAVWWPRRKERHKDFAIGYADTSVLKRIATQHRDALWWLKTMHPRLLRTLFICCMTIAIAMPTLDQKKQRNDHDGIDIMMVIDTSGSMRALDLLIDGNAVDRLSVVKHVITEFIGKRVGDRIGLVVFGNAAFTQAPLTLDHKILVDLLQHIRIGMIGENTAMGDGLAIAVNRIKDVPGKSKVLILLTDGKNTPTEVDPLDVAQLAADFGIKIYTIGVGREGQVPFPAVGFLGGTTIRYVDSQIDEKLLQDIANKTNAKFYRAKDTESLEEIYRDIDQLEKVKLTQEQTLVSYRVNASWLVTALLLILVEIGLSLTRWRLVP